jgi:nucleoside-diphosphate-sugar epimerase
VARARASSTTLELSLMNRHILSTGGTGFIGSHLVSVLPAAGLPVRFPNPSTRVHDVRGLAA